MSSVDKPIQSEDRRDFLRDAAIAGGSALSLSALAVVTIVFLQWFNGGQYGIALLLWLTLGWVDRAWTERRLQ